MYRQIADDLRAKIESGELTAGAQLPTETELMTQYRASRNTIRDAIKWLGGLVDTRAGQGTFVTEKPKRIVTTLTGDPATGPTHLAELGSEDSKLTDSDPKVEILRAPSAVAEALRVKDGSKVVSRQQQRFIGGTPWSLQTSYYPMSLVDEGATGLISPENFREGTVNYLGMSCGIIQVGYSDSIEARQPDSEETAFFRLPGDGHISVFEIFRIAFDQNGSRFRLTVTVYPADRNRFKVNMGEIPPDQALGTPATQEDTPTNDGEHEAASHGT
jgi:GntR family transcriptional regulator